MARKCRTQSVHNLYTSRTYTRRADELSERNGIKIALGMINAAEPANRQDLA